MGLMAASISAIAFEREPLSGDQAMSAFRNSEDCSFYRIAAEKTRAAEASMRLELTRLTAVVANAESSLKSCTDAAGLNYETAHENDVMRSCSMQYDRRLFTGVQLQLVEDELSQLSTLTDDIAVASEVRCGLPKLEARAN